MLKIILPFLKKNKKSMILIVIVSLASLVLEFAITNYNGKFIDYLLTEKTLAFLYRYLFVMAILMLSDVVFNRFFVLYKTKIAELAKFDVYKDCIEHLHKTPINEIEKFNPTYLNQRLNIDITTIYTFIFDVFVVGFFDVLKVIAIVVILINIDIKITICSLIFIILYIACFVSYKGRIKEKNIKLKEEQSKYYKNCNEQMMLYKEIRMLSNYEGSINFLKYNFKRILNTILNYTKVSIKYTNTIKIMSAFFSIVILYMCGKSVISGDITIGLLVIITTYYKMLLSALQSICNTFKQYQETISSVERMNEIFEIPIDVEGEKIIEHIDNITFENISFGYFDNNMFLNNLDLNFEKEKSYAIIGKNGIGKTTLILILIGLYKNMIVGEVKINGNELNDINMRKCREDMFSICIQNEYLPDMTVKEYFFYYGLKEIEELEKIICQYRLDKMYFAERFNIYKFLDKRICKLSGGEKQKIILLRALLKESEIMIFDEINSNLDEEGIGIIKDLFQVIKKRKIVLVVSHNEQIIQILDEKVYL